MNEVLKILETAYEDVKAFIENDVDPFIVALVKSLWATDSQLAMQALNNALLVYGKQVVADAPGTSAKTLGTQFLAAIEGQFAGLVLNMAYQDVLLVIAAVIKQINPPQVTGNAGNLTSGVQQGN